MKIIVLGLCCVLLSVSCSSAYSVQAPSQETGITDAFKKGQTVFLCFSSNDSDPALAKVKSELNGVDTYYKGAVAIFYIKNSDAQGKPLFANLKLSDQNVVVYTLTSPDKVISRLEGKEITKTNLLRQLMTSCGSGCKSCR